MYFRLQHCNEPANALAHGSAYSRPNRDDCIVVLVIVARPLVAMQIDATEDPLGSFETRFAEVEVKDTFNRLPEKFSLGENVPTALL
jgi:hypothetical protein